MTVSKNKVRVRTITFQPSKEVRESLTKLTAQFRSHGHTARGIVSFYINAGLEQSLCRPDFKPNHTTKESHDD